MRIRAFETPKPVRNRQSKEMLRAASWDRSWGRIAGRLGRDICVRSAKLPVVLPVARPNEAGKVKRAGKAGAGLPHMKDKTCSITTKWKSSGAVAR